MIKRNGISLSLIVAATIFSTVSATASDLGTIQVESSTIVDKFKSKKSEVSNTTTISGEVVDESHAENIQQVLQSIPGVTSEVSSGDSLKIHLRGVENQMYMGEKPGVAIVIDGVPVFERTGSVNIDLDNIESIKVIKGGASYLFGDDALSGAVIITTKKGSKYANNEGAYEFGSYGYQKLLAKAGYANDALSFHIQASERKADGYHEDSSYSAKYLNGKLQYYIDDSSDLTFGLELSKRKKDTHGTVGGAKEAKTNPESRYRGAQTSRDYARNFDVDLLKLFLTYSKDFSNNTNLLLNGYMYQDHTTFKTAPQTRTNTGATDTTLDDNAYVNFNDYKQIQKGVKSEFSTSSNSFATLLGLDLRSMEKKNKTTYLVNQALITSYFPFSAIADYYKAGDLSADDKTDEYVYAGYGEYKQGITQDLIATANLRYDLIKLNYKDYQANNNHKKDFNVYSYRLGLNYQLNDKNTLFTNFSTGFRAPSIDQLYAGDNYSAYNPAQSNPNLKPEQSNNYEIGLRGSLSNINYEASLFQIDRYDFIMKSSGNYGKTSTTYMWDNIGGARHRGLELALNGPLTQELSFNLAYTYLDAVYTDYTNFGMDLGGTVYTYDVTGNTIPRTSKHQLNVITNYQANKELKFSAEVNAKSSYYADDLNKLKIKEQAIVNLGADYKTKVSTFDVKLFVKVDNVFDNFYYNTVRSSSDRDGNGVFDYEDLSITVNPGRVYTAGLSVKF